MELTKHEVREIIQKPGIDGMIEHIDYCAGVCYNRHGLSKDSYRFVRSLYDKRHMRPLEFGTANLAIPFIDFINDTTGKLYSILDSPYTKSFYDNDDKMRYITTNFRGICEVFGSFDDALDFVRNYHSEQSYFVRRTAAWKCARVIADEFRTHVTLSSLMKSTRYVNEMKNGMSFTIPYWFEYNENGEYPEDSKEWLFCSQCEDTEIRYNRCINEFNMKPQEARDFLPLGLETELYQCGFIGIDGTGWNRFFEMRIDPAAHPDAQVLATELKAIFEKSPV